ncbi:MAG: polyhydroxyalkanoic acid system family protein [Bacteriovorax sp.]|nr:polyhydroxyalkanoic acid system family protein [Bacteriovorax sp.]
MGLKIDYKMVNGPKEAYDKVKSLITPEYIQKFQVKADVSCDDTKKIVKASGSGFTLTLQFLESHCDVDLELSLILRALKSKILEKIEHQITKNL